MSTSQHWLLRRNNIRKLWVGFILLLASTVVAGLFVHQHAPFGFEDTFAFYALYGFFSCVLMVVGAKLLGLLIKRPDTYYQTEDRPHD